MLSFRTFPRSISWPRAPRYVGGAGPAFDPASLFANGRAGGWYDPSDLSTMFQDSAGTIPVTAGGDPVGRVLDKSGNSVPLSQSVLANSFTAVRMPLTGRRNLLTWTEEFANTAWNAAGVATNSNYVLDNTAIAPNGTMTASHVIAAPVEATSHGRRSSITGLAELTTYRFSFYAKAAEYSVARAWSFSGGDTSHSLFNLLTGETNGNHSAQMLELADGWWRCSLNVVTVDSQTTRVVHFGPSPAFDQLSFTGDGVSGIYAWGAQLELGSTATPYQRVTNANDVREDGVPDVWGIVSDYSGDVLPATLPFAIDGEILIAGTNGTIIEPVSYDSGSTFNLGTDTYTGGTPGILRAIGPIVGVVLLDRAFTDTEKAQLIAYYKGRGAKGLLVPGPELMPNPDFSDGLNSYTAASGATIDLVGGKLHFVGVGADHRVDGPLVTEAGKVYEINVTIDSIARGNPRAAAGTGPGATASGTLVVGNNKVILPNTGTSRHPVIYGNTECVISLFSVRELRPQEDWT